MDEKFTCTECGKVLPSADTPHTWDDCQAYKGSYKWTEEDPEWGRWNSGGDVVAANAGKTIIELTMTGDGEGDDELHFVFDDGARMSLLDNEQLCCELRYMTTDDNLKDFVGAKFESAEVRDGPQYSNSHEIQFLIVHTSKGSFTIETHNEHNGYYGGFDLIARAE